MRRRGGVSAWPSDWWPHDNGKRTTSTVVERASFYQFCFVIHPRIPCNFFTNVSNVTSELDWTWTSLWCVTGSVRTGKGVKRGSEIRMTVMKEFGISLATPSTALRDSDKILGALQQSFSNKQKRCRISKFRTWKLHYCSGSKTPGPQICWQQDHCQWKKLTLLPCRWDTWISPAGMDGSTVRIPPTKRDENGAVGGMTFMSTLILKSTHCMMITMLQHERSRLPGWLWRAAKGPDCGKDEECSETASQQGWAQRWRSPNAVYEGTRGHAAGSGHSPVSARTDKITNLWTYQLFKVSLAVFSWAAQCRV